MGRKFEVPAPLAATVRAKVAARPRAVCPECAVDLTVTTNPGDANTRQVCPSCAAIFIVNPDLSLRSPKTQEWIELLCQAGNDYLFDARDATIDRLTKPK